MLDDSNTLEVLVNLIYLARHSTDEPQKMIEYLNQADRQVWQLAESFQKLTGPPHDGDSGDALDAATLSDPTGPAPTRR